jgi:hypothetical protein
MAKKIKKWTESELVYLNRSISDNVNIKEMAKKLGRTTGSIYSRIDYERKLKTISYTVSVKKELPVVSSPVVKMEVKKEPSNDGLWEIRDDISLPKGSREKTEALIIKCRKFLSDIKVNQSFTVPSAAVRHITNLSNTEFSSYRIKKVALNKERKFFRIFRLA